MGAVPKSPLQRTVLSGSNKVPPSGEQRTGTQRNSPEDDRRNAMKHTTDQITHDSRNRVMQRHSDIAELIVSQQKRSLLAAGEMTVFNGSPLTQQSFIHASEHLAEDQKKNNQDRLCHLEQFTSG